MSRSTRTSNHLESASVLLYLNLAAITIAVLYFVINSRLTTATADAHQEQPREKAVSVIPKPMLGLLYFYLLFLFFRFVWRLMWDGFSKSVNSTCANILGIFDSVIELVKFAIRIPIVFVSFVTGHAVTSLRIPRAIDNALMGLIFVKTYIGDLFAGPPEPKSDHSWDLKEGKWVRTHFGSHDVLHDDERDSEEEEEKEDESERKPTPSTVTAVDEKMTEKDDQREACTICFENKRKCVAVPCGHLSICYGCSTLSKLVCCICNQTVDSYTVVYKS